MKYTISRDPAWLVELYRMYDFFLLDLDNTLYDETNYLYPSYRAIASNLNKEYGWNVKYLESFLIETFEGEGRENLLNKLCVRFAIPQDAIDGMLSTMRTLNLSTPITLFPAAKLMLDCLVKENKKIFIVTNGNWQQQQNKVRLIDWGPHLNHLEVIYTALFQPKPHPDAFNFLRIEFGAQPEKSIMIGDSIVDEEFAKNSGIRFLNANDLGLGDIV